MAEGATRRRRGRTGPREPDERSSYDEGSGLYFYPYKSKRHDDVVTKSKRAGINYNSSSNFLMIHTDTGEQMDVRWSATCHIPVKKCAFEYKKTGDQCGKDAFFYELCTTHLRQEGFLKIEKKPFFHLTAALPYSRRDQDYAFEEGELIITEHIEKIKKTNEDPQSLFIQLSRRSVPNDEYFSGCNPGLYSLLIPVESPDEANVELVYGSGNLVGIKAIKNIPDGARLTYYNPDISNILEMRFDRKFKDQFSITRGPKGSQNRGNQRNIKRRAPKGSRRLKLIEDIQNRPGFQEFRQELRAHN